MRKPEQFKKKQGPWSGRKHYQKAAKKEKERGRCDVDVLFEERKKLYRVLGKEGVEPT